MVLSWRRDVPAFSLTCIKRVPSDLRTLQLSIDTRAPHTEHRFSNCRARYRDPKARYPPHGVSTTHTVRFTYLVQA